jgi:hypothetical protein
VPLKEEERVQKKLKIITASISNENRFIMHEEKEIETKYYI